MEYAAGQIVPRGLLSQTPHLHIAESMIGEMGFERLFPAPANEYVLLILRHGIAAVVIAQVLRIDGAVRIQHFAMPDFDGLPFPAPELDPAPAHHVLPQIENKNARRGLRDVHRAEFLGDLNRLIGLGHEFRVHGRQERDRLPGAVIEARRVPSRHFPAGIVGLPADDIRSADGALVRDFPTRPGDHRARGSIFTFDFQLRQEAQPRTILPWPQEAHHAGTSFPACADHVFTRPQSDTS